MRKLLFVLVIGTAGVSPALAQQAPPPSPAQATQIPQTAPPAAPTQTPAPAGQRGGRGQGTPGAMAGGPRMQGLPNPAVNVKLELSITDTYAGAPAKKTVTLLVSNGNSGMIRTSNRLPDGSPVNLNVDAMVEVFSGGVIGTRLTFQYTPAQSAQAENRPAPRPADLNESVNVLLQDGKLTVVSQSADPATDRKVTVEVTATIIR